MRPAWVEDGKWSERGPVSVGTPVWCNHVSWPSPSHHEANSALKAIPTRVPQVIAEVFQRVPDPPQRTTSSKTLLLSCSLLSACYRYLGSAPATMVFEVAWAPNEREPRTWNQIQPISSQRPLGTPPRSFSYEGAEPGSVITWMTGKKSPPALGSPPVGENQEVIPVQGLVTGGGPGAQGQRSLNGSACVSLFRARPEDEGSPPAPAPLSSVFLLPAPELMVAGL